MTDDVTAIVTVADNGGASGRLRTEFGSLPPGDLRMALAALCGDDEWGTTWARVVQHRFGGDGDLSGHSLGNLLIAGLWDLLGELHRAGQTILLTTHYMEEADRLCERVAIMDHGKILALDTPAALKQSIGADTVVTVKAAGDAASLAETLERDVTGVTRARIMDGGVQLHVQGNDRLVPRVVAAAERAGFDLIDLSISEPSLETVFINLTGKELRED